MKILITGITGFAGSHLAEYMLKNHPEVEVCGIIRWRSREENIQHIKEHLKLFECDLRDPASVRNTLKEVMPDKIFHLAAQSFVPTSWRAPSETITTNIVGQINIFEAMRDLGLLETKIQLACSSEEYGLVHEDEVPITENNPLRPLSPYGVSKIAQDYLGYQYHQSYGIKAIRTRTFNHTGPRRGEVFVVSTFAKQIALVEKGRQEPKIFVGNLEAKRDFTDVRDVVRAYWLSTEHCLPGEVYNIASGETHTIQFILDTLLSFSKVNIQVIQDPARMRPSDVLILHGDSTKFRKVTGWKPEIKIEQTLKDTLDYWRENIQ
ncbi:MAG TPA: SDR family oxidoreductase [Firmicutes bacterium]|nr:SDR family oxidoreductase [Bacillota bacterium]